MSRISLRDIAKMAGVSPATVSYALNNSPEVSKATRARIQTIAKSLNYSPNRNAQGLRTQKSKLICMLINTFTSLFNGSLVDEIRAELNHHGYSLVVIGSGDIALIDSQLFDGLIVFNYATSDAQLSKLLDKTSIPIILMANETQQPNTDCVVIDNTQGMQMLVNLFAQAKHQNLAILTGPNSSYNSEIRLESCKTAIRRFYPEFDFSNRIANGKFETSVARRLTLKFINQGIDFFFCLNDAMAYGVFQAAAANHLRIGVDISVVGFDNNNFYLEHYKPRLTTIDPLISIWSNRVVTLLIERLTQHSSHKTSTIYSPIKLIPGHSVAFKH